MTTMNSNFADRFYWARHRAGIGAPTIASTTGCSQGLIYSIEHGTGAESSEYNDKFAKLFGVNANWLKTGEGREPDGFDPKAVKRARQGGSRRGGRVIDFASIAGQDAPRWAGEQSVAENESEEARADALQKRLFADFQDYAKLVGPQRTGAFLEVLTRLSTLMGSTPGQKT